MPMGVNLQDFIAGCKAMRGVFKEHNAWEYTCVMDKVAIGLNINGLVQVFDYRNGINEIHMKQFDHMSLHSSGELSFHSATGKIVLAPTPKGIEIKTDVRPRLYGDSLKKYNVDLAKYGRVRFDVPQKSIMRMLPPPIISKIDWEPEVLNVPLFVADSNNLVKGTTADFLVPSNHTPEFEATVPSGRINETTKLDEVAVPVTVSFVVADEMTAPQCIPVGDACYARYKIDAIAEEILGQRIIDTATRKPVKGFAGRRLSFPAFQSMTDDFPGVLRIVTDDDVNYIVYKDSWLTQEAVTGG